MTEFDVNLRTTIQTIKIEETFLDFLKYLINKYGEKDLSIKNWTIILKTDKWFPFIELYSKDDAFRNTIKINEDGTIHYPFPFYAPKYVTNHIEKCIKNMHYYFQTEHQVFKQFENNRENW